MGLDPKNDDFPTGDACGACAFDLFDNSTPLYVEARIKNIVKCPNAPPGVGEPPNDNYLLTQTAPCVWSMAVPGLAISWSLFAGRTLFLALPGPMTYWFQYDHNTPCVDIMTNDNVCNGPLSSGGGGSVLIFWGPLIGI